MRETVYLSLGSNILDRVLNLNQAEYELSKMSSTRILAKSQTYETKPVGYLEQENFLNRVLRIETELEPLALLQGISVIENKLGRTREFRWGPRTIDIDILLFGEREINYENLFIPHPRMFERAFVLIPLKEVYHKEMVFEKDHIEKDLSELILLCEDREGVRLYKEPFAED